MNSACNFFHSGWKLISLYLLSTCPRCLQLSHGGALKFSKHILFHLNLKTSFFNIYCMGPLLSIPPNHCCSYCPLGSTHDKTWFLCLYHQPSPDQCLSCSHVSLQHSVKTSQNSAGPPTTCCSFNGHSFTPAIENNFLLSLGCALPYSFLSLRP